jgi:hypothetical protein
VTHEPGGGRVAMIEKAWDSTPIALNYQGALEEIKGGLPCTYCLKKEIYLGRLSIFDLFQVASKVFQLKNETQESLFASKVSKDHVKKLLARCKEMRSRLQPMDKHTATRFVTNIVEDWESSLDKVEAGCNKILDKKEIQLSTSCKIFSEFL